MKTTHTVHFKNNKCVILDKNSIDLVVTSPPYPMIDIWDNILINNEDLLDIKNNDPYSLCNMLCDNLINIFIEYKQYLKPGALVCINVGDATRTINSKFAIYPNHSYFINKMLSYGYTQLPSIIWEKPNNSPTKFMGSGMLPGCAYVTLGHEYILIFKNGSNRIFTETEKKIRRQSAYFWEERNIWFSDMWRGIHGDSQKLVDKDIERVVKASFPLEIPRRLIRMFSIKGDTVLDPFLGTGTTTHAAISEGRNSVGIELDTSFKKYVLDELRLKELSEFTHTHLRKRLLGHSVFVDDYFKVKPVKHINKHYNFPVITGQETDILFHKPEEFSFNTMHSDDVHSFTYNYSEITNE